MRRTGQKPRRTGHRGENGGGINHGAFEEGLDKINRIGAQRRKTAAGSPKGERSESMSRIIGVG